MQDETFDTMIQIVDARESSERRDGRIDGIATESIRGDIAQLAELAEVAIVKLSEILVDAKMRPPDVQRSIGNDLRRREI